MPLGIGAGGILGLALEATPGTYVAPTKFIPFTSESLVYQQANVKRRPIRANAGLIGVVAGNSHVAGDIEFEALEDVVPYFLLAGRTTCVKTGTTPDFTYTFTPDQAAAISSETLSLTLERVDGIVTAYTGCVVGSFKFGISDGLLTFSTSIISRNETSQTAATPTWPVTTPYGAGMYSIEIPTATPVTDTDTFEFTVEDNAEPQFRLKSTGRSADFVKFGERATTLTAERDFTSRADYDAFKALTAQSITISATKGVANSISILMPVAIKDTYEVGIGGQGDLVRASIAYDGVIDSSGNDYTITIKTQEDITP